ncbi:MAG: cytochrome c3 family protein [Spirochaetota bacterium]|nr:cytochrome c3 family protein [Spirochaetota bacterium]
MNNRTFIIILIYFFIALFSHSPLFSVDDNIILPKTGHRKPQILFNHKAHSEDYEAKCIDCHHKAKNQKCSKCHLHRDKGNIINIKGAFHQQCHDCHRRTSGPKACGRCHKMGVKFNNINN